MTKAQDAYERVEALVGEGSTKADAYVKVAEELGLKPNSVRGAYYQHTRKLRGGSPAPRSRKRETTTEDAVASAIATLEQAVESIDAEIEAAKDRAEEAQREYDALQESASERKEAIQAKIEALSA